MQPPKNPGEGPIRAISPLVGTVLLIGLTTLTVAVLITFTTPMLSVLEGTPSIFVHSGQMEFEVTGDDINEQQVVLIHRGGQSVPVDDVDVVLDTDDRRIRKPLTAISNFSNNSWKTGEPLKIQLNTDDICTGTDEVSVSLVQFTGQQSHIVGETSIPVRSGGFTIDGGKVVPQTQYSAKITIVGAALTYGEYGPDIDVSTEVTVGNTTSVPWPYNVNDGKNPRTHTFTDQPANAGISVSVTRDPSGEFLSPRTRHSKNPEDGWVYVLRDGDEPPTIRGYGDQNNVTEYLSPYINESGSVTLADNEAIFLFELGNSRTGDAADFQDIVVLATIEPTANRSSGDGGTGTSDTIVCPDSN